MPHDLVFADSEGTMISTNNNDPPLQGDHRSVTPSSHSDDKNSFEVGIPNGTCPGDHNVMDGIEGMNIYGDL